MSRCSIQRWATSPPQDRATAIKIRNRLALPAILFMLMQGQLGTAVLRALLRAGLDPVGATATDKERALCEPEALVFDLTPPQRHVDVEALHRPPRYRWAVVPVG